jgi:hypothetical protein
MRSIVNARVTDISETMQSSTRIQSMLQTTCFIIASRSEVLKQARLSSLRQFLLHLTQFSSLPTYFPLAPPKTRIQNENTSKSPHLAFPPLSSPPQHTTPSPYHTSSTVVIPAPNQLTITSHTSTYRIFPRDTRSDGPMFQPCVTGAKALRRRTD